METTMKLWINDHLPLTSETPHGGFKQSGFGKDLSVEAISDYQVPNMSWLTLSYKNHTNFNL